MAVPWLRLIDAVLGVSDVVRLVKGRGPELERQQIDAERQRAERALRLDLLRQAGDREIGRMRLVAVVALTGWLATLLLASTLLSSVGGRTAIAAGWVLLLLSIALAFVEQLRLARVLAAADHRPSVETVIASGAGGLLAPWLAVAGLAVVALGVLVS